ncbi:unnamed protein product [Tuwongella immobilis]|uniref:Uncharacterized protein n=1 Tax=Tuwongella immobilis TaxID=692036 RepID=A0A6C2YSE2_9BACT|nr:unnamed protein product [Tuwongella immobilis]VTS06541.1 unnamed protein product [Tuwongella immobilis]
MDAEFGNPNCPPAAFAAMKDQPKSMNIGNLGILEISLVEQSSHG